MQIKTTFARFLRASSDPATSLKQSIRELEDQVPELNEALATLKAEVSLVERELARLRDRDVELGETIAEAWERERPDIAANYALTQDSVRAEVARQEAQLTLARSAFERARRLKRAFMDYKEESIQLAKEALNAQRRAEWHARVTRQLTALHRCGQSVGAPNPTVVQLKAEAAQAQAELRAALDDVLGVDDLSRDELHALVGVTRGELRSLGEQLREANARLERLEERLSEPTA